MKFHSELTEMIFKTYFIIKINDLIFEILSMHGHMIYVVKMLVTEICIVSLILFLTFLV